METYDVLYALAFVVLILIIVASNGGDGPDMS